MKFTDILISILALVIASLVVLAKMVREIFLGRKKVSV